MGDHLNGRAQIFPAPFAIDNFLIDLTGGHIIALGGGNAGKAFIMTKIKIGLSPIIGDKNFAVLIGTHRAGIDIEIGVQLTQSNLIPTSLKECTESCGCNAFAEGGNHAAGYENITRHGVS